MSNKASKIILAGAAAGAAFCAVSYMTFREVMHRDAKLPQMIAKITEKSMAKNAPAAPVVPAEPDERVVWFEQQHFDEFTIKNSRGANLRGYLLKADAPSDVYVFCSHGYRNHALGEFRFLTKYHHDAGRNVFLVDHQAAGESEGTYIGFGYHEHNDCMQWLGFMRDTFGENIKIFLHGVSMGCATVMLMCGDADLPENVKFAVADCGYTSALDEFKYILGGAHVPSFPILNGADFFNNAVNGFHFRDIDPKAAVARAKIPMLFIHGKTDTFVPTFMATELYDACSSPYKDLLLVDDAWHAESYCKDSAAYEAKVNEFEAKFIADKVVSAAS